MSNPCSLLRPIPILVRIVSCNILQCAGQPLEAAAHTATDFRKDVPCIAECAVSAAGVGAAVAGATLVFILVFKIQSATKK
jgi:hypothetical protein